MLPAAPTDYQWQPEPIAADLVSELVRQFTDNIPFAAQLSARMLAETGTRLIDWVDHFVLSDEPAWSQRLEQAGFSPVEGADQDRWVHAGGLFPAIRLGSASTSSMAIQVDSVADFLAAHRQTATIEGDPLAAIRSAMAASAGDYQLTVLERHGSSPLESSPIAPAHAVDVLKHHEAFLLRRREFDDPHEGFEHARQLISAARADLGVDRTCDLFFAAERQYWQHRNRAARIQKLRQDQLGLGWANHDHHTYRSSREHFAALIRVLEELGFVCRERFYGGADAGWGAQVLEQPATQVVIFADVDLTPEEVTGDFAHEGLSPQGELGTVGLWCKLHGEAFLQAGMHHLECQFDFNAAREQLAQWGVQTMAPFTDFPHLKQAFTAGERWAVDPGRLDQAVSAGFITAAQAEKFRQEGSIGSHLEILERNQGYKGFNQTGISEIIRQTDPRRSP